MRTFLIPGISNSGPEHWQTHWEKLHGFKRIQQEDWENPFYSVWEESLVRQIERTEGSENSILIGHSLGCLLIAKALGRLSNRIRGVFLVAPPDPNSAVFPKGLEEFGEFPQKSLGTQGLLLFSENDPYSKTEFSENLGKLWNLETINLGELGHINAQSQLGNWDSGFQIFSAWVRSISEIRI
ncbi:RBBP9/YdeN family alpha/beta hydrolase [Leptospira stimsonii]|uniref:Alpha/beta hydrolase n=1 Tax=Leptospira stimsonii TaxID=2202203 RepID=A0A4R9KXP6_9LEPT|nr:alpha/beta hydrolase [Leptospira stimsonii]RHX85230.1 alpha/beta hydrolase [Leptospira stimsonii]TGK15464.1 alpha/beta hydrolase [Leptospira stimsonii]TGM08328.1 alpha/beta hydrolase [Leptospira stimsonii]